MEFAKSANGLGFWPLTLRRCRLRLRRFEEASLPNEKRAGVRKDLFAWLTGICFASSTFPKKTSSNNSRNRWDSKPTMPRIRSSPSSRGKNSRSTRSSTAASSTSSATKSSSTSATRAKASSRSTSGTTRAPTRSCRPKIGDEIQVLLEAVEDESGAIVLSYRKAKRQKEWEDVIAKHKEGDVVSGLVTRKIKGGLLVNIGVNVFLPASQVDIRRPPDIGDYIGKTIECKILKIDEARRNIVVSRRKLIEDQRERDEEEAARRDRAGPDPQGRRQEHRRVRRVRRPRRHRRPAAHHRHELGPRQQPARSRPDRPGARGLHHQRGQGQGEDRPGPQAEVAQPVGRTSRPSTRSAAGTPAKSSTS